MICVKFTAFCNLRVDLWIRLATLRKSERKFWFSKLASTWVDLRVRLARALHTVRTKDLYLPENIVTDKGLLVLFATSLTPFLA